MPPYIKELGSRKRAPGLPVLGDTVSEPEEDPMTSSRTPFRLPRVRDGSESARSISRSEDSATQRVWGRHGYEFHANKPADIVQLTSQYNLSPRVISQEMRRVNLRFPRFNNASIGPANVAQKPKLFSQDFSDPSFYKGLYIHNTPVAVRRAYTRAVINHFDSPEPVEEPEAPEENYMGPNYDEELFPEIDPSPSPVSRSFSPVKSARSIRWTMNSVRHMTADRKGQSHAQGPYSREYTVHVQPPTNWLRLRLGQKSRSTMV